MAVFSRSKRSRTYRASQHTVTTALTVYKAVQM